MHQFSIQGLVSVPHTEKYLQKKNKLNKGPQILLSAILEMNSIKKGIPDMFQQVAGSIGT
jgi:hypothetical protein